MIISALTGASFVRCCFFDYPTAIRVLNDPPAVSPNNVWEPVPWIESSAQGTSRAEGAADLDRAIALAPESPGVRLIVADAYTYGNVPDPQRAFAEASFELAGGLNTPRLQAIFARVYLALGNQLSAAAEFRTHIELVIRLITYAERSQG